MPLTVGLACTNDNTDTIDTRCNILEVDGNQFGATESTGEADRQQCSIPFTDKAIIARCSHGLNQIGSCRQFAFLSDMQLPADTLHRLSHSL
jgi:hypothetical protein